MPTVLRIKNYRFFFFSRDYTEPAHIHVESSGKYAKYWLEPVLLVKSRGYKSHELNEIHKIIEENFKILLEQWDEYFRTGN
jgi:hypothetical protein